MNKLIVSLIVLLLTACGGPRLPEQTHTCTGTVGSDAITYSSTVHASGTAESSCTGGSGRPGGANYYDPADAARYRLACVVGNYYIRFIDGQAVVGNDTGTTVQTILTCN